MRSPLVVPNLLGPVFTLLLLVLPVFSQPSLRQELIDEHLRREQAETLAQDQTPALIPPTCLPAPLPSSPRPPVFTMQAVIFGGDQVRFEVWREPCTDNSGRIVPLLRATPLSGTPFVCSSSFTVIQAGIQYDIQLFSSSTQSSSLCDDLFVPTTALIGQFASVPQFDDTAAFQLIFQGDNDYRLDIPPAPPANGPMPDGVLTLSAPAATVLLEDYVGLFIRGQDDRVYVNWRFPDNQWTGWGLVPGGALTPSTPAAIALDGFVGLFIRGLDDRVYVNWRFPDNQWTGWGLVPD